MRRLGVPLAVFAALVLSQSIAAAPTKEVRRVLILNEANPSYPAMSIINQGIQTALNDSPYHLELYSEHLDTLLFPDPAVQQEFHDFFIRKYRNRKPDVIITVGPSPLKFMQEAHQGAFRGVPIVFCLPAGGAPVDPAFGPDFTGVGNDMAPAETLAIALRLLPGTEHVVVVGGRSDFEKQVLALLKQQIEPFTDHLDVTYMTDLAVPELLERLKHLPRHTIVLLVSVGQDAEGNRFKSNEIGPLVAAAANAPVFSFFDVWLNHGEVGGYLSNVSEQGKVAGSMALRILKGEKPWDIPQVKGVSTYMFDWRALKRWGLDEKQLPPGSIVLDRQTTAWESYKWYIIAAVVLVLAETLLILGLIWHREKRRRSESRLRESEERFRLVANTAPVMIWVSGTDRMCNYFNKPWLEFTGRSLEQELGNGWADRVHPEDLASCLKTYNEAFDKREAFEMQYRLQRYDGEYRWVLDNGLPRFNQDGSFAGYIGSCLDITERILAEQNLANMGRRLIEAHEEERTWIGRELHDDIVQRLALLAVALDRESQSNQPSTGTPLQEVNRHIREIADDVQALSHRLHSSKLDYLGLATAAKSFCREMSEKSKVEVVFHQSDIPTSLPKEVSLCIFRVLQEALQNAVKHSGVGSFSVDLHGSPDAIELKVADMGYGFDEREAFTRPGLGLISMRERLQMVNGELEVKSRSGGGTTIYARVPLKAEEIRAMAG